MDYVYVGLIRWTAEDCKPSVWPVFCSIKKGIIGNIKLEGIIGIPTAATAGST